MKSSINLPREIVKTYDIDVPKLLGTTALAGFVVGVVIFDLMMVSKLSKVVSLELRSPVQNPFVLVQKPAQEMFVRTATPAGEVEQTTDLFDKYFGEEADLMRAICTAESGLKNIPSKNVNSNGTQDHGICQINDMHADKAGGVENLYNPEINVKVAKQIRDTQGLTAWTVYKSGAYRKYL